MSPELLLLFCLAALLLALSPGPDNLFVLTQSFTHGAPTGVWITLGLCTGLMFHTIMVVAGVTAMIAATPALFTALKWLGAAYLCYLAWQVWNTKSVSITERGYYPSRWGWYRRGVVMNLSNPKVGLFFLAFLPQFISPQRMPVAAQLLILGGVFILVALLVFTGIALLASRLSPYLQQPVVSRWLHRVSAGIFVLMAVRLLIET